MVVGQGARASAMSLTSQRILTGTYPHSSDTSRIVTLVIRPAGSK